MYNQLKNSIATFPPKAKPFAEIAIATLLATVASAIRKHHQFIMPGVSQEEGYYLKLAVRHGIGSLGIPSAGYFDTIGRIGALISARISFQGFPEVWLFFYLVLTGIYIYFLWQTTIFSRGIRMVLITSFLLFPTYPEWQATPLYGFWIASLILFQLEIYHSKFQQKDIWPLGPWLEPMVKIPLILSGPLSILLIPIYVLRLAKFDRRKLFIPASCLAACLIQLVCIYFSGRAKTELAVLYVNFPDAFTGFLTRFSAILAPSFVSDSIKLYIGALLISVSCFLLAINTSKWPNKDLKNAALIAAYLGIGSGLLGYICYPDFADIGNGSGARYIFVPMLLAWQCLGAGFTYIFKPESTALKVICVAAIASITTNILANQALAFQKACPECIGWAPTVQRAISDGKPIQYRLRYTPDTPGWTLLMSNKLIRKGCDESILKCNYSQQ
jgi:hypothetical protein